ncbi:programmed cell death protein 7 [Neodiprion pinetum]|uniref:programmed cell death protein 7 n=1 Tax=Neodiprion pinetum TaxID=441929 RepID=UPI001EDDD281|nr:uncharacterized protein LOC124214062 [Neodiprion pinetum]
MYRNQNFAQIPPHYYDRQFQYQLDPIHRNYEMQMQQNFIYPSITNAESTNIKFINFNPMCNNVDNEKSVLIAKLEVQERDERMIENFLKQNENPVKRIKKDSSDCISKISEARSALVSVFKLHKELKESFASLAENRNLPEYEWNERINTAQNKRFSILETLSKLKDDKVMSEITTCINKRKKKRLRQKKQRVLRKIEKLGAHERRIQLHAEADAWIKLKQDIIEKEKQENDMRRNADIVLAEVRGKRNDAKKFFALLHELKNLRCIEANIARARGEHLSTAADESFTNIIDKLLEQWKLMDREYSIEEQGLRLMLKTNNDQKIENQKRNIFDDWESALFGRKLPAVDIFQRNIHGFITIRAMWDKYISCDGFGSPIPIGWVMPDPPSSAAWQKYLKK